MSALDTGASPSPSSLNISCYVPLGNDPPELKFNSLRSQRAGGLSGDGCGDAGSGRTPVWMEVRKLPSTLLRRQRLATWEPEGTEATDVSGVQPGGGGARVSPAQP